MVRIITDSAADFTSAELEARCVTRVSMPVRFSGEVFYDGVDLTKEAFYARLEKGELPQTSQPSPETFRERFEAARAAGDEVVAVLISSALSGTFQGANFARSMLDDPDGVYIVDSKSASLGQRLLVDYAVRLRDGGRSAREIAAAVEAAAPRVRFYAVVDTLKYLQRGGRLSRTAAAMGTLANLKPIIQLPTGAVEVVGKAIGMRRAIDFVVDKVKKGNVDPDFPVYTVYSRDRANCDALLASLEKEGCAADPDLCFDLGPTIGAHIGPGACGAAFITRDV